MLSTFSVFAVLTTTHLAALYLANLAIVPYTVGTDDISRDRVACPCSNPDWCKLITDTSRNEVFIFSLTNNSSFWGQYDWSRVTTVVSVGYASADLMCHAHKHGARVVGIANIPTASLTNQTARKLWTEKYLKIVKDNFLDGLNIDFEGAIRKDQPDIRDGYTQLVSETNEAFKRYNPSLQVTVDVAWSPDCVDQRCYDYKKLANISDFVFVMAYDERSQIFGPCVAGANSAIYNTIQGLRRFLELGVPPHKLVLGIPWYGYRYTCLALSKENVCTIKQVPFRGVRCSDAAGGQHNYGEIMKLLKNSTSGRLWDISSETPYFNYKDPSSNQMYQLWYDDPESLTYKYQLADKLALRGVGCWNGDALNYIDNTPEVIEQRKAMWDAMPKYPR